MSNVNEVEQLGEEIAGLAAHLDAATHRLLTCIRRFDEARGWGAQGAMSCAHWLTWRVGLDAATAREKVRVARALGTLPAVDEALQQARLSYAKVRALTRVATPENEALLLQMALHATGAQLERLCRGYRSVAAAQGRLEPEPRSVSLNPMPGGMVRLELVLHPDEASLILHAIDRAREVHAEAATEPAEPATPAEPVAPAAEPAAPAAPATEPAAPAAQALSLDGHGVSAETPWPSRADGAIAMAESFLAGHPVRGTGGERFQVIVHLDQDVLGPDGVLAGTLEDGTSVSAETLRRVACDCGLVAATRGGADGEALSIGRRSRTIPPAIRRALNLRYHGCAFPGCTHTRFLHAHHIKHWLHGGETSVENLLSLCTVHHRLVHEGGWKVAREENGKPVFTSPTGLRLPRKPPRPWRGDIGTWLRDWASEHGVDPGPDTNRPLWDGCGPDYCAAVEGLLGVGERVALLRRRARFSAEDQGVCPLGDRAEVDDVRVPQVDEDVSGSGAAVA
jgi:hypothetical protein